MFRITSESRGKKKKREAEQLQMHKHLGWKKICVLDFFPPTVTSPSSVSYSNYNVGALNFPGRIIQSSCPFLCSWDEEYSPRKKGYLLCNP